MSVILVYSISHMALLISAVTKVQKCVTNQAGVFRRQADHMVRDGFCSPDLQSCMSPPTMLCNPCMMLIKTPLQKIITKIQILLHQLEVFKPGIYIRWPEVAKWTNCSLVELFSSADLREDVGPVLSIQIPFCIFTTHSMTA